MLGRSWGRNLKKVIYRNRDRSALEAVWSALAILGWTLLLFTEVSLAANAKKESPIDLCNAALPRIIDLNSFRIRKTVEAQIGEKLNSLMANRIEFHLPAHKKREDLSRSIYERAVDNSKIIRWVNTVHDITLGSEGLLSGVEMHSSTILWEELSLLADPDCPDWIKDFATTRYVDLIKRPLYHAYWTELFSTLLPQFKLALKSNRTPIVDNVNIYLDPSNSKFFTRDLLHYGIAYMLNLEQRGETPDYTFEKYFGAAVVSWPEKDAKLLKNALLNALNYPDNSSYVLKQSLIETPIASIPLKAPKTSQKQ